MLARFNVILDDLELINGRPLIKLGRLQVDNVLLNDSDAILNFQTFLLKIVESLINELHFIRYLGQTLSLMDDCSLHGEYLIPVLIRQLAKQHIC